MVSHWYGFHILLLVFLLLFSWPRRPLHTLGVWVRNSFCIAVLGRHNTMVSPFGAFWSPSCLLVEHQSACGPLYHHTIFTLTDGVDCRWGNVNTSLWQYLDNDAPLHVAHPSASQLGHDVGRHVNSLSLALTLLWSSTILLSCSWPYSRIVAWRAL